MPSRRLSRGYVPQRKQALDPEAGLLSLAPSGGPLGSMTGAELPRRSSKPEWDWARFDNRSHNRQSARGEVHPPRGVAAGVSVDRTDPLI
jgi:hypothetical protein